MYVGIKTELCFGVKVSCIDLEPWSCLQHMYVATQRSFYMATHQYVALSVVLFKLQGLHVFQMSDFMCEAEV